MRFVGFSADGPDVGASWRHAVEAAPQHDSERIARYLDAGEVVLMAPEFADDGEDRVVRSDGEWAWPGELGALVREHRVHVPDAFVDRMRASGFDPPSLDPATAARVVDTLIADGPLALVPESFAGDPLTAPESAGPVPDDVDLAGVEMATPASVDGVTSWDYLLAAGLDPEVLEAEGVIRPDGSLAPELRAELGSRLGWHPPDPAVEREVDAVLEGFMAVLLGRAERVDVAVLDALERRADRRDFWLWLAASVIETDQGILILYPPVTIELITAVLAARGDATRVESELGPLRMAGLRALASAKGDRDG